MGAVIAVVVVAAIIFSWPDAEPCYGGALVSGDGVLGTRPPGGPCPPTGARAWPQMMSRMYRMNAIAVLLSGRNALVRGVF